MSDKTLQIAMTWHELGISVIPILFRSKRPAIRWSPYIDQLPRKTELQAWFASGERNIAVLTGGGRGLVVIDFDDIWRYSCWLANLSPALAKIALATYRVVTRRGLHFYFYVDEPTQCNHTDGIDIKAFRGYVIAPPSIHPTGHIYRAIGHPSQIQRIESERVLLPEIENHMGPEPCRLKRQAPQAVNTDGLDALDAAMIHRPSWAGDSENGVIARIKATWSFDDLLGSGNGHRRGVVMVNCPLHHDTTASLAIYPDGHAHCFGAGCAFHGDVLNMFAAMHNLTISEAIRAMSPAVAATRGGN